MCKGPEIELCVSAKRDTEEVSSWSGETEGESGRRRGGQGSDGQIMQDPVGCGEDFGFYPEQGGSHGGF